MVNDLTQDPDVTLVEDSKAAIIPSAKTRPKKHLKLLSGLNHNSTSLVSQAKGKQVVSELKSVEVNLDIQIREYNKKETTLKRANKILSTYEQEVKINELIEKWRRVCQCAMAYLFNSTMLKINKMGGYHVFRKKEIEKMKRQLEYQSNDGIQDQIDELLESDEFLKLCQEEQDGVRERVEEKLHEAEKLKEKEMAKIHAQLEDMNEEEFTMQELAARIKVEYHLVYP
ncbi:HCL537Wp [Eremothecium sinecaudum]|uniref:HCL537Wp n=1 Tax=Eremothecium sinecaudum TaxID=45286 RepID=A0A109UY33_9SACH|nr:HCL537Wp [Eremothecium sinecaudum]AMD19614.1 HCL537Wp [Eremothecium sinecaudum]